MAMSIVFIVLSLISVLPSSSWGQASQSQKEEHIQVTTHLRHLVEDVRTMLTYFEMDNSSVIAELTRQVAELRQHVRDLNERCGGTKSEITRPTVIVPSTPSVPPASTTPAPTFPPGICGDIMRPLRMRGVPEGWVMCYLHMSNFGAYNQTTTCRDLVSNLSGGYTDADQFTRDGGEFGCWTTSLGLSGVNPVNTCRPRYQNRKRRCRTCDVIAACLHYPGP